MQAWLNGEFGIDDEPALIEALRRDPRVIGFVKSYAVPFTAASSPVGISVESTGVYRLAFSVTVYPRTSPPPDKLK